MLINKSSTHTKRLERIIKFCSPRGIKLCDIIVKDCKNPHKNYYSCDYHWGNRRSYIVLRYGHYSLFPLEFSLRSDKINKTGYFGSYYFPNKTAAMIFTIAHELRHHFQHEDESMKFWLYHDKKKAEIDADQFAFERLEKYYKLREKGIDPIK